MARRVAGWSMLVAMPGMALAHMPYVAPSYFDAGDRKLVTVEASFTEDAFHPDIAMKDAPFDITGPDGVTTRLGAPTVLNELTIVEAKLPSDGIYRISSGQRLGRIGKMYRAGTEWKLVGEGNAAPAGAALVDVQSTTLADAYVARGKPQGSAALTPRGAALEIHPLGDPTTVGVGEPLALEILYRGKPLAGASATLFREAGYYDGKKVVGEFHADAAGKLQVAAPDAGRYLLLVRHRDSAPAGAAAPYYSYTTTLAFEAM
jgi:uncharacterized GH25 family protein